MEGVQRPFCANPGKKFQLLTLSSTIILATIGETNPQIVPIALLMPIRDPA